MLGRQFWRQAMRIPHHLHQGDLLCSHLVHPKKFFSFDRHFLMAQQMVQIRIATFVSSFGRFLGKDLWLPF